MVSYARSSLAALAAFLLCTAARAQPPAPTPGSSPAAPQSAQPTPPPPAPPPSTPQEPPPPASAVAATVNGQPIPEIAVYRALLREAPARRAALRPDVINFLIENALVDQYLEQAKVAVDPAELEKRFQEIKKEIEANGDFKKVTEALHITESDLRTQILCILRFEKFTSQYATDKALRDFFTVNRAVFDASQVKARHILLKIPAGDAAAAAQARAKLLVLKKQIEDQVAAGLKTVAAQDKLAQEKARIKLLDEAFAAAALKESACASKSAGGELGWFPRSGRMVEPFAKAAFALKPYEMSDVVATDFGLHLILATDQKPGREVQYEKLQEIVKEVYLDRLRETLVARLRPSARITITPPAAPKGK